jgi:hypothetical protein
MDVKTAPGSFWHSVRRPLSEIAGPRVLLLTLFPLLPLNELFKQSLGFFGRFFSRSSDGGLGNSRVFASLYPLKLFESFKQCLGVFGRRLGRCGRRRRRNGNGEFRGIAF